MTAPGTRWDWLVWPAIMVVATAVLYWARADLDQSHAALTLLLVVLGGSVAGGRTLGFSLAAAGFGLIDYFFQPPFDQFAVNKPLDGVVLVAFVATAFVTTELLVRTRQQKAAAEARASEVETLARLGAETLRYAEPEEALDAISRLVQDAIAAESCVVLPLAATGETWAGAAAGILLNAGLTGHEIAEAMAHDGRSFADDSGVTLVVRALALPLRAEQRVIGVMVVRGTNTLRLDAPRRRLLAALGYYATLGVERMQLKREAARSEALRQAQRARDEIFAAVSHDLRTPITTIKVLAQDAAARGGDGAAEIVEQADRLARMVADLLELSRLRTGSYTLSAELNTAEDLVGAAVRQVAGARQGRTIAVHVDLDAPALVGRFDFVHTLRIMTNLLDNALRHAPASGTVDVHATRNGQWLELSVADRGAGVSSSEQNRIFDAFYRPADATPDAGHAGLGLSIARGLAELQGGSVHYEARPGGGSVFVLRLPAAEVDDLAGTEPA